MDIRLADQGDIEVGFAVRATVAFRTLHSRRSGALEVVGAQVAQGGVPTSGVVPALDELEDGHACLGLGLERLPFDQLALQGGEEAIGHGVVVAIPGRPGGGQHSHLAAALAEGQRRVLESNGSPFH